MGDINEIIQFRFKRSDEAFEEALLLFKAQHYNSTVIGYTIQLFTPFPLSY